MGKYRITCYTCGKRRNPPKGARQAICTARRFSGMIKFESNKPVCGICANELIKALQKTADNMFTVPL